MSDSTLTQTVIRRVERALLACRLRDMAEVHERVAETDDCADAADALARAAVRDGTLCPSLLREALAVLEALP